MHALQAKILDPRLGQEFPLPQYATPDADIYAVYPQRHQLAARVRAFVDFLAQSFGQQAGGGR